MELNAELARARRYYDGFASTYERRRDGEGRYHDLVDDLEVELVEPLVRGREVLEVGCGTGLILRRLSAFAARAVGVDLSPGMLERAKARGLEVVEGSATELPFADGSFDVAVSFKTLPHVPDLRRALAEMARVVRPGGTLVVELYNPRSLRALVKRLFPAGKVASGTERDVFVRFDDRASLEAALPVDAHIVGARGVRVVTLAGRMLDLPWLGARLAWTERALADTPVGVRYGGFVSWILRRT